MLASKIAMAAAGLGGQTYVEDVFSTYLYTGTGAANSIVNGIDLAGEGGLVWIKDRGQAASHQLSDTIRGVGLTLFTNLTSSSTSVAQGLTAFNSDGFSVGTDTSVNQSGQPEASWTFRKAPNFFDVVTWTGNGANRTIAHALGSVPGMIIVKRTDTTSDWQVYHRGLANTEYMVLNTTAAKATGATRWNSTTATDAVFSLGTDASVNASGGTYVAYVFAHDTSDEGLIQCGSFTSTVAALDVTLGWEPQFLLWRSHDNTEDWHIMDSPRGFQVDRSGATVALNANLSAAESAYGVVGPTATGFTHTNGTAGRGIIYMAIRRPNKPPESGTDVYNAIARTGTAAAATITGVGFPPDLYLVKKRTSTTQPLSWDRLRGAAPKLITSATNAEDSTGSSVQLLSYEMDGIKIGTDSGYDQINGTTSDTFANWFFRRAPGFFDVVCYTGTGVAKTEAHNLGVVPELMIVKCRSVANAWKVYHSGIGPTKYLSLNETTQEGTSTGAWNDTAPTASVFTVGTFNNVNQNTHTFVAYLFATLAGISKVGSYTGNGSSQTIDCGFAAGARFILIKRTDASGDWYVWDTVRGIIAGNDPHLSLNTTTAEVTTDDSIDTDATGFVVNELAATNINVTSATYIYLAIA